MKNKLKLYGPKSISTIIEHAVACDAIERVYRCVDACRNVGSTQEEFETALGLLSDILKREASLNKTDFNKLITSYVYYGYAVNTTAITLIESVTDIPELNQVLDEFAEQNEEE